MGGMYALRLFRVEGGTGTAGSLNDGGGRGGADADANDYGFVANDDDMMDD